MSDTSKYLSERFNGLIRILIPRDTDREILHMLINNEITIYLDNMSKGCDCYKEEETQ